MAVDEQRPILPGRCSKAVEERTIEPLAWIERAGVTDPEGTNFSFDVTEKEAAAWAMGAYQQGHLYMFPLQATGRFPYSIVDYPALKKEWVPPVLTRVTGVIAGTNNHTGAFPRIEIYLEKGYVKGVKGGGLYGELWREFLKYPKINDLKYPYIEQPGYWWIYEAGLGTNPKAFKRPDENLNLLGGELANSTERLTAGTLHWGFGLRLAHDPKEPKEPKEFIEFANGNSLPNDHWWHIHNLLPTYKVKVRGTKNTWLTLIYKGELTALKSPEIRALASRYGDPKEVLSEDWAPHLPGINAAGRYEDYAKDPWKTVSNVIKKIEAGTYEYFYPPVKKR